MNPTQILSDLAEEMDWDTDTQLEICLDFIEQMNKVQPDFNAYVQQRASEEYSQAEEFDESNEFEAFQTAVKDFQALQNTYRKTGADDTEPDTVFQKMLYDAFHGNPKLPTDWQLYEGEATATESLTNQAKICLEKLLETPHRYHKFLQEWIDNFCWRVS
jgi:hypothetical protein